MTTLVKFPSHRMRQRASAYIKDMEGKARASFKHSTMYGVYEVSPAELAQLKAARKPESGRPLRFSVVRAPASDFFPCWH